MSKKLSLLLSGILILLIVPILVYAHIGISSSPTTACISIDSIDLKTHTGNQIDNRISANASSTGMSLFSNRDLSTSTPWVRNSLVWTDEGANLDFTGVSPWNTYANYMHYTHGATLISPRHFVAAVHFGFDVGDIIGFVDASGNHVERTVSAISSVAGTDIEIGILNSDVPDSITYYPIMASSTLFSSLQKIQDETLNIPMIVFDQESKAIIHKITYLQNTAIGHSAYATSSTTTRKEFSETVVSGDSGQPGFLVIDNQPILLFAHATDVAGPNLGNYISQINTLMTSLGGGYQVTQYEPTCFTEYQLNHYAVWPGGIPSVMNAYEASTTLPVQLFDYTATDPDGDSLSYRFEMDSGLTFAFSTTSDSGILTYSSNLNFETLQTQSEYDVLAEYAIEDPDNVFDDASAEAYLVEISQTVAKYITAYATDDGDFPSETSLNRALIFYNIEEPPVFTSSPYTFSIAENSVAGTAIGSISATDEDYDETVVYSIESGNSLGAFQISESTGAITVASASPLDYESRQSISLVVMASSTDNTRIPNLFGKINYATTTVTINITDVSDTTQGASGGGGGGGGGAGVVIYYGNNTATSTTDTNLTTSNLFASNTNGLNSKIPKISSNVSPTGIVRLNNVSIARNISVGSKGEDVRAIQKLLNSMGYTISTVGAGSPGNESNYFGIKTKTALARFQKAYNIKPTSGLLGPLTRNKLKDLIKKGLI